LEAVVYCLTGCGFLSLGAAGVPLKLLDPLENAYLWQRADVVAGLLLGSGSFLIVLGIWSQALAQSGTSLRAEWARHLADVSILIRHTLVRALRRAFASPRRLRALLVVLCLGVIVRGYFLSQPMRYDESNTFLHFVNGNLLQLFFYPFPNNHVFHTILVKLSTSLLGAHPQTIRLPAFLAGVISIPLIFCVGRVLLRGRSAAFAALAVALLPYLILYSTNARGYTLMVLFTLLLVFVGVNSVPAPSKAAAITLSVIAALGLLTVPSMAFPIAGVYLWLVCLWLINRNSVRQILRDFVIPCALLTFALTAIFYSPVIFVSKGVDPVVANEHVAAQPSELFFHKLPSHLWQTLVDFSRDVPVLILIAGTALMLLGVYSTAKRRDWAMLLLLPCAIIGSAVLLVFKHAIPYPRTWIFLLPLAVLVANAGWIHFLQMFSVGARVHIHRGLVVAAVGYAVWLMSTNAIAHYPDTGTFPEAAKVAHYLRPIMHEGDKVRASIPADYPLYFYLWYDDVRHFHGKAEANQSEFIVLQKDNYEFETTVQEPVVKLVDVGEASVYQAIPTDESPQLKLTE
jgi:hypothetical protein